MELVKINLTNFRNYDKLELNFDKKNTIFIGDNAQGKTNILESIYFLSLTKSFLNVKDCNLIKFNTLYTKISGVVCDREKDTKLEVLVNNKEKKVKIDNTEIIKLSNYISKLNVVIFSPDNVRLLKESPNYRRKYLNIQISQLYNKYLIILSEFNKILKQRNEYLKTVLSRNKIDDIYLDILNRKYATLAVEVYLYRNNLINKINEQIDNIYFNITGFDGLKLKFISNIDYYNDKSEMIEHFYEKLGKNLKKDLIYKMTLLGPQRDDFCFLLQGNNLLQFGSQGQIRCAILALKFCEVNIFSEVLETKPVVLLDDIFSELDIKKRNNVIDFLNKDYQTIITTTDLSNVSNEILKNSNIYMVENGNIIMQDEGNDMNE